ncbi:MAG: cupin domain-containing protein [Candidatus Dormibacteria bacterium]
MPKGAADAQSNSTEDARFTGMVWRREVIVSGGGISGTEVMFQAGARTYWHTHRRGQVLVVVWGRGLVVFRQKGAVAVCGGDVLRGEADDEHWHGAQSRFSMGHVAVTLGETKWASEVSPFDYQEADRSAVPLDTWSLG